MVKTSQGKYIKIVFTNVRCVPSFKYTLLSVDQLWEEQRIDARFRDLHHLQLPPQAGGLCIPYDPAVRLNSITMISVARMQGGNNTKAILNGVTTLTLPDKLSKVGKPQSAATVATAQTPAPKLTTIPLSARATAFTPAPVSKAVPIKPDTPKPPASSTVHTPAPSPPVPPAMPLPTPPGVTGTPTTPTTDQTTMSELPTAIETNARLLGFHAPTSVSHIAHLPTAQAGQLMHRRSHMGHRKISAFPQMSRGAPKNLCSFQGYSCLDCATANINTPAHSGSLDAPAELAPVKYT